MCNVQCLSACMATVLSIVQGALIIGGNFNAVMDPSVNRQHSSKHQSLLFKEWADSYIWLRYAIVNTLGVGIFVPVEIS